MPHTYLIVRPAVREQGMSAIEGSGVGNLELAADEVGVWRIHLVAPEDMIHR